VVPTAGIWPLTEAERQSGEFFDAGEELRDRFPERVECRITERAVWTCKKLLGGSFIRRVRGKPGPQPGIGIADRANDFAKADTAQLGKRALRGPDREN
jgi:hypothetical protein